MQPEPPAVTPARKTPASTPDEQQLSTQHGIQHRDDTGSPDRLEGRLSRDASGDPLEAGTSAADQLVADAAFAASLQHELGNSSSTLSKASAHDHTAENTSSLSSVAYGNTIEEYGKASAPPGRHREGPAFEAVKSNKRPGEEQCVIQSIPNEILTHALAHLSPTDLTAVSLVSKRFHELVTGPHAWRSAFSHYFLGPRAGKATVHESDDDGIHDAVRSDRRAFTRLTALASWRSEYVMRTRLLRSLSRGKPVQAIASPGSSRSGQSNPVQPIVMYNSQLFTTVTQIHATFGTGLNKRPPRLIHAADDQGTATSSDPTVAKVDLWGLSDPQLFVQFAERFPGDAQYGLGQGNIVGVPNVVDVSQPYGLMHGEGSPGGGVYYRSTDEMRGRFLKSSSAGMSSPELGIPRIPNTTEAVCAVWIAKSNAIPSMTNGLIGLLSGSSSGTLSAYSLGSTTSSQHDQRFARGELTARWTLSPGVPLIAISVDTEYSLRRYAQNRIWAVVLNALGEVFYLTKFPRRPIFEHGMSHDGDTIERTAWLTGRTVYWNIVETSRRKARPDPYADSSVEGSYFPRTSWNGMCLGVNQIRAETREIETFAEKRPKDFQKTCIGWDMRRKIEVDFGGDDGNNAGENVIIFDCGLDEGGVAAVVRYSRYRWVDLPARDAASTLPMTSASTQSPSPPSLFGGSTSPVNTPTPALSFDRLEDSLSRNELAESITSSPMGEEWRSSIFALGGLRSVQISVTTMDRSILASQTASEDPLLGVFCPSAPASPSLSPAESVASAIDIPGQRARLFAVGTKTGIVLLWNVREAVSSALAVVNTIEPLRVIFTDSPQVSCLGLSSLYLVHGGNDGLVQAWDPLASVLQPIRTLNSRFASRARRRLIQAQASPLGVGVNLFAAGAIHLDPDPTVLRGVVSLGTHLRYWSYSSSTTDQYKSHKRRTRRSARSSNNGGERFSGASRSNLKDYIANEKYELEREKRQRREDTERFARRFGTELLGGSEEEMLAYAAMLSQESLEEETRHRASDTSTVVSSNGGIGHATPSGSTPPPRSTPKTDEEVDADVVEAIRLSLAEEALANTRQIPIRSTRAKGKEPASLQPSSPPASESSRDAEWSELQFAMQLSLAEERSRAGEQVKVESEEAPETFAPD